MSFTPAILAWYRKNARTLPWRETSDPYRIWLSEIILQQTRVDQGMPYYHRFIEKFPDIRSLAKAKEETVLRLWQGLGYYSRARNLHAAARQVVKDFDGKFPADYEKLKSLKGVGEYTAAAIASFAFGLPHPVVDGNVFRLLSRYFGIDTPIDTTAGKKEFISLAEGLIDKKDPATFNQAIMEFGSMQCRPANPDCGNCPLVKDCFAFNNDCVDELPVKQSKTKVRMRYFHYFVIRNGNSFYLNKRKSKDIWLGLFDFPMIESSKPIKPDSLLRPTNLKEFFGKRKPVVKSISHEHKHILSHQKIHARFYELHGEIPESIVSKQGWIRVSRKTINKYALPRLIEKYLEEST